MCELVRWMWGASMRGVTEMLFLEGGGYAARVIGEKCFLTLGAMSGKCLERRKSSLGKSESWWKGRND